MNKTTYLMMAASVFVLTACGNRNNRNHHDGRDTVTIDVAEDLVITTCDEASGYMWSEVQQRCIRAYEAGLGFTSNPQQVHRTNTAYAVFNNDSSKVELYLPNSTSTEVLDRRNLPDGSYAWNVEDDDTKNVRLVNGEWVIEQRGNVIYRHAADANPIKATFEGKDSDSELTHIVYVTFYPVQEKAVVNVAGETYELMQYATADGYGYKDDNIDLRGKGDDADLTYMNNSKPALKLKEKKD